MANDIKNEDCYYYNDVRDMGGIIPTCDYYHKLGYCPCEGCGIYIRNKMVSRIIRQYIDEQLKAEKGLNNNGE